MECAPFLEVVSFGYLACIIIFNYYLIMLMLNLEEQFPLFAKADWTSVFYSCHSCNRAIIFFSIDATSKFRSFLY